MFKFLVLYTLAVLALGQDGFWRELLERLGHQNGVIVLPVEHIGEFTVQYDDEHDIVIVVNRTDCYIIEAESEGHWTAVIADEAELHTFIEIVYILIQGEQHITALTHSEVSEAYHSRLETWECNNKDVHRIAYRYTFK